ncbi:MULTISPECIES: Eco57I restriction-modification methylase domain-containing protein [Bacillus]|uniref:Eco57I restriction-modification methylase domain-containing protein n=1 Tax=Bacillus TaxID=1386 RepID=UPI00163CFAB8|nr:MULTISPECIES: Eco57I restriction-modification methylase domain-containing protein [Bacillus]QNH39975.1 Eco57I restriction-modification methylase domain-containing protein [Bacillus sp. PAMC26543]QPZ43178.1 Eco57I restriction-modification methylase domain-containing protein [Bacillus halotolerans]
MLVNQIYETTIGYGQRVGKNIRKKIGQFFTPPSIANYMASLMEYNQPRIRILDTGAGTGILTGGLCQSILENDKIKSIHIDLYENDDNVLPLLRENMELVRSVLEEKGKAISYTIFDENFILSNDDFWNDRTVRSEDSKYNVVISNPPYKKIAKTEPESVVMSSIVHGQPNIYFLFMAMSAKLLKENGEMIFITPRSFTSGLYFRKFREYFLNTVRISNIHLYHSRLDVFDSDKVLQEAIIIRAIKTSQQTTNIALSASENPTTGEIFIHEVPYGTVVDMDSANLFMLIPTTLEEIELLTLVQSWDYNLLSLGFKLKTGPVVDFRALELIQDEPGENTVPLLWSNHFVNNKITFPVPVSKNPQYIVDTEESKSVLLPNKNYLLVKRFSSKEERRRVQCSLYFKEDFENEKVGIENHLNYITKLKGEMAVDEMYGLYVLFNSTFIDTYYRILNGSTQVNATEMNAIPLPSIDVIKRMGRTLLEKNSITTESCDTIIEELFTNDTRSERRNVV